MALAKVDFIKMWGTIVYPGKKPGDYYPLAADKIGVRESTFKNLVYSAQCAFKPEQWEELKRCVEEAERTYLNGAAIDRFLNEGQAILCLKTEARKPAGGRRKRRRNDASASKPLSLPSPDNSDRRDRFQVILGGVEIWVNRDTNTTVTIDRHGVHINP